MVKPQGAVIIIPFLVYGLWKHRKKIFFRPEYYAVLFSIIPFITDYLANPHRFGDLIGYFSSSHNAALRGGIFYKIGLFLNYTVSSDSIFWILSIIGLILLIRAIYKNLIDDKLKEYYIFMVIFFIFMSLFISIVMLPTYYYLVYLNLFEASFVGFVFYSLWGTLSEKKSEEKTNNKKTYAIILCVIMIMLTLVISLMSATSYFGINNEMYKQFDYRNYELFSINSGRINDFLSDQPVAVIGGDFGHEYQYYIDKPVFRACILLDKKFNITRALVTNLEDLYCKNETDMIKSWKFVNSFHDDAKNETIYLYQK